MIKDTIREMKPEVIDVLRIILKHQPERATMKHLGGDYQGGFQDIAFCASSAQTIAKAQEVTGASKTRIEHALFRLIANPSQVRAILVEIPAAMEEVILLNGVTGWPIHQQYQAAEDYKQCAGDEEKIRECIAKYATSPIFPALVADWLLDANDEMAQLRAANADFLSQINLASQALTSRNFCARVADLLRQDNERQEQLRLEEMTEDEREKEKQRAANPHYDEPIEDHELSVRTYNCLKKENINTIGELVSRTESQLMQIRNWGRRSQNEVYNLLDRLGLKLKE